MKFLFSAVFLLLAGQALGDPVLDQVPAEPNPSAYYIFYSHGRIVEDQGPEAVSPRFGAYDWHGITQALADGAIVIAPLREADADPDRHADWLTAQVSKLIAAGVPADHITLSGFSKGGYITLLAAARMKLPDLRVVVLAGCFPGLSQGADWQGGQLSGAVLSMVDASDQLAQPCAPLFARNPQLSETRDVVIEAGSGHGLFYQPDQVWLGPLRDWAGIAEDG